MLAHIRTLLLGNGLAQALQFCSILVLSRIYQPADFGLLAQVQSIATVFAIVATLQLHLTIPLCRTGEDARATAERVQTICVLLTATWLPIAVLLDKTLAVASLMALILGLANTYTSYLVFGGRFGRLSAFYVARAVLIIGVQIGFAKCNIADGLLWATIAAEGIATAYLRVAHVGRVLDIRIQPVAAYRLAVLYKSFSIYGTLQELTSVTAFYAPLLLYTQVFGRDVGGQYAMANRLVWAPVILLSGSVAQVLYHRFGQATRFDAALLLKFGRIKWVVAALLTLCLGAFYMDGAFLFALGPQWVLASKILPLQLLWGCIFLLSTPFRVACRVLHLQRFQLAIDASMLAAIVALFMFVALSPLQMMLGLVFTALVQNCLLAAAVVGSVDRHVVGVSS